MGGRGRSSGLGARQMTIEEVQNHHRIIKIVQESAQRRKDIENGGGVGSSSGTSSRLLRKCMCCGEYTIPVGSEYEVCCTCGWIDDKYQNSHPESLNGRNPMTLSQMKDMYWDKQMEDEDKGTK